MARQFEAQVEVFRPKPVQSPRPSGSEALPQTGLAPALSREVEQAQSQGNTPTEQEKQAEGAVARGTTVQPEPYMAKPLFCLAKL